MKNAMLPLFVLIPFFLIAQEVDYCPCQEAQRQEQEIFEFFTAVNTDVSIYIEQKEEQTLFVPPTIQVEEAKVFELPKKEVIEEKEVVEKEQYELEEEEEEPEMKTQNASNRSKFKKSKKRFKKRVKRQKKARKYKGKCPMF